MTDEPVDSLSFFGPSFRYAPQPAKDLWNTISKTRHLLHEVMDAGPIPKDHGIFSYERNATGKRNFFISSYETMFMLLPYLKSSQLYEVIPEMHPCKLYLDIEYKFEEHPDWDGNRIVQDIIVVIQKRLADLWKITDYEIIDLTATTKKKFSRHIIIHSDNFCFKDNFNAGEFVRQELLSNPLFAAVIDPGVYSKNRNFRCVWATKFAVKNPKHCLRPFNGKNSSPLRSSLSFFRKTLIADVGDNVPIIPPYENVEKQKSQAAIFSETPIQINGDLRNMNLEQFALAAFAPGASFSSVRYVPAVDVVTLVLKGNRFCRRIGREHKSNAVYLLCRLQHGTIVQKCFDPECAGFESDPVAIPEEILEDARNNYSRNPELVKKQIDYIGSDYEDVDINDLISQTPNFIDSDSDEDIEELLKCSSSSDSIE